jgi:DNA polymerase elongation subunit (family B)
MRFQYFSCAVIRNYVHCRTGQMREHNEVHFALFGRDVANNEPVAVTFRYCPYLLVQEKEKVEVFSTHSDTVRRTLLHGFPFQEFSLTRVFVPRRTDWERANTGLDCHHTLESQMLLVLGLRPLDVVVVLSQCQESQSRHTNVHREYHIASRLSADRKHQFPLALEPQQGILCTMPTILSFDIEAYSFDGSFPKPGNSHTIAICFSLQKLDGTVLGEENLLEGSESDLLVAFRDAVIRLDPDIITGWNTNGFDWNYLLERAKRTQVPNFAYLDKVKWHKVHILRDEPQFAGRVNFDAMAAVRTHKERVSVNNAKPASYKLEYIAQLVLGKGKQDLSIPEMRKSSLLGNVDVIGAYCLTDAKLPLEILQRENLVNMLLQVAALSGASLQKSFHMTNSSLVHASLSYALHNACCTYN